MLAVVAVSVGGLRRVGAHQQPRAPTVPLEARATATGTFAPSRSLVILGGFKGMLRDPQTELGLIGLGLLNK
jgi:hypothetical protein